MAAEGIGKSFGDKTLFKDLNFVLTPGMRIGILGGNGTGKSTLLKILSGELTADEGQILAAPELKIVKFDQGREILDKEKTLWKTLAPDSDSVMFQGRSLHVASYASRFLFRSEALNVPVGRLSGGEQARVLIARLMLQTADVLLLDEPTNDLDIDTLEVLEESLEDFPGAVVLITHDRLMLDRISQVLIALEPNQTPVLYADYAQWLAARKPQKAEKANKKEKVKVNIGPKPSAKEKKEWQTIESQIEAAEAEKDRIQDKMGHPEVASDAAKLHEAYNQLTAIEKKIELLYARWAELEEIFGA